MTTPGIAASEQIAIRDLLGAVNKDMDAPMRPEWERAAWAVPRSVFVPERVCRGDELEPCDRTAAPVAWLRAVYANGSVVTQINDGKDPEDGDRWASSSASAPSIMFRMLHMLDVQDGRKVLEIGTERAGTRVCCRSSPARRTSRASKRTRRWRPKPEPGSQRKGSARTPSPGTGGGVRGRCAV